MANTKGAEKAVRQASRRRVFNIRRTRSMKEEVKALLALVSDKKKAEAQKHMPTVQKAIDKAAKMGVIKKNTASRKKSRLNAKVAAL